MVQFLCPPNYATGGTEAIFSCVDMLFELGIDAELVLCTFDNGGMQVWGENAVPERFKKYRYRLASSVSPKSTCVVCPEGFLKYIELLSGLPLWIWWLSIDNAFDRTYLRKRLDIVIGAYISNYRTKKIATTIPQKHLCQSAYSRTVLERWGMSCSMLTDYVDVPISLTDLPKTCTVSYNARRGQSEALSTLSHLSGNVEIVPIINMTVYQVQQTLARSMICLDFGFFPGKDRLVREATLLGNVVLTSKIGSAGYFEDFGIDSTYKFSIRMHRERQRCLNVIRDILNQRSYHLEAQSRFRTIVSQERDVFRSEVISVFRGA